MEVTRAKQIAFCALQMLRNVEQHNRPNSDWKDIDDWIFSELDIEIGELEEIYAQYPNVLVYGGSCFEDGHSPKNYDVLYFQK